MCFLNFLPKVSFLEQREYAQHCHGPTWGMVAMSSSPFRRGTIPSQPHQPVMHGELGQGQVGSRALASTQESGSGPFLLPLVIGSWLAPAFVWLLLSSDWNRTEPGHHVLRQSFRRLAVMAGLSCYALCGTGNICHRFTYRQGESERVNSQVGW